MSQELAEFVLQVLDGRSYNHVLMASIGQSRAWFWYILNEISAALFTYDTLLTLSRKVEHIWKPILQSQMYHKYIAFSKVDIK
ncbi:hypothetical protein BU17DRAFT_84782 [Hysterangium stoloniferum]|nr:hypothetical protein BU17DRAFT_84782 [Hysterangium stoloniferum]